MRKYLIALSCLAMLQILADGEFPVLDVNTLIRDAAKSAEKRLVLPAGIYRADTVKLHNLKDFTLDGNGATLVFANPVRAIDMKNSKNLQVKNLTIDYDPLPFTQGVVTEVNNKTKEVTVKLHDGYPAFYGKKLFGLNVYDPKTRKLKVPGGDLFGSSIKQGENDRIWIFRSGRRNDFISTGDLVALDWRKDASHAVYASLVDGLVFENVTILAAPDAAFIARFCSGEHRIRGLVIKRGDRLPRGATEPRLLSSVADGINYGSCEKGPVIENCDLSFLGDDSVNLHGNCSVVYKQESPDTYVIYANHDMSPLVKIIKPDAPVRILKDGNFEVIDTVPLAQLNVVKNYEIPFETLNRYFPRATSPGQAYTVFRIKFNRPIELAAGTTLDFLSAGSNGFIIRNNYFHDHRARGLRLKASNGIVENNRIERLLRCGILLGGTYYPWREAGWTDNVTIRNNQIIDTCSERRVMEPDGQGPGAITVQSDPYQGKRPTFPGNRNVVIEGNRIENCQSAGIYLGSTNGAIIRRNTLRNVNNGGDQAKVGSRNNYNVDGPITVSRECLNVKTEDNDL